MNKKYVYIFSNTERADLVKIGKTNNNPRSRARTLSNETGAIGHFVVEWFMEVPDNDLAEKILFYKFRENHYDKEFFKIDLNKAVSEGLLFLCDFFDTKEPTFYLKQEKQLIGFDEIVKGYELSLKYSDEKDRVDIEKQIYNLQRISSLLNSPNQIKDF